MRFAFDLDHVLANAQQAAGLDDFGDLPFVEALEELLRCAKEDLEFSNNGRLAFESNLQRWLVNRLRYVNDVKINPAILNEDVSDPIVVIGMPRSGTTKMQRLLSSLPGTISLPLWMTQNPAPFPGEEPGKPVQRIEYARAIQSAQAEHNPDFLASHERKADEAEEDSDLLLFAFDYLMMYIIHPSERFLTWLRSRPRLPAYEFQKRLLQYLQWQQGGKRGRRWILKNPGHIGQMDALTQVYPKATLVHLHRDLREVLPSYCRLIQSIYQELFVSVDPRRIGRETLAYWGPEFRRQRQQRQTFAEQLNILDVSYQAAVGDSLAVVERLFEAACMPLDEQVMVAIRNWEEGNKQHKHGRPSYSMAQYGLDQQDIMDVFGTFDDGFADNLRSGYA
ncbi:MAG: sulfotransferase [Pseudomonadota bacterium]